MTEDRARDDTELPAAFLQAELFAGLSHDDLLEILGRFKTAHFESGETILRQGEPAIAFYLVAKGKVKVVQTSHEGLEVILHIFKPGGVIGALPSLGRGTYPASAITLEPATTYFIGQDEFERLMIDYPTVTHHLLTFATRMLQSAHRRLRELATERVERRIALTLVRLTRQLGREQGGRLIIEAPLSRQDLAEMSGTTLYTVSRTLKKWERQGVLLSDRKRVEILNPHQLIAIAEDLPENPHSE
jgi:CRP-like cAMP-binding protein